MQHLMTAWHEVEPLLTDYYVLLFLDYDGTLTPIVEHPRLAQMGSGERKVLEDLTVISDIKVIIMSGRLLEELRAFVAVPGLIYVGNHGIELEGQSIRHVHPVLHPSSHRGPF